MGDDDAMKHTTPTPCRGRLIVPTAALSALEGFFHVRSISSMTMIAPDGVGQPTPE
jgi:hypothetical protein